MSEEFRDRAKSEGRSDVSGDRADGGPAWGMGAIVLDEVPALRYVSQPEAPTYRAVVQIFFEARERYRVELKPGEVLAALVASPYRHEVKEEEHLEYFLGRLSEYGNLAHRQDMSAAERLDDFYRRAFVYRLTAVGEAAHRAVAQVERAVGESGSLQANMLVAIRDALIALAGGPAPGEAMRRWHDLHAAFSTLTEEATRFLGGLGQAAGDASDEEAFRLYKQALLGYIGRFIEELRRLSGEIAAAIARVDALPVDAVLEIASRSGDLPPRPDGADPAAAWIAEQRPRWAGLKGWFIGAAGERATVDRLADAAVDAVVGLTRTLNRLSDRRVRPADRAADLRALAGFFAEAPDDAAAHALYQAAFGLYGARHLHLAEDDAEAASASASWWESEPVEVPVALRSRGREPTTGKATTASDFSASRRWIATRVQKERARQAKALGRFIGRGPIRMSELGSVDDDEFDALLGLLDEALCRPPDGDGARAARTSDGRFDVVLTAPEGRAEAIVTTPRGTLRCEDYTLTVSAAVGERRGDAPNAFSARGERAG